MIITAVVSEGEDGWFAARCPSLRGCWTQGKTREAALANLREAVALYFDSSGEIIGTGEGEEVVEILL